MHLLVEVNAEDALQDTAKPKVNTTMKPGSTSVKTVWLVHIQKTHLRQAVKIVRQEKLPQQEQWDKMAVSLALVQVVAPTQPALQASVLEINVAQARVDGIPVAAQVVRATVAV